MSSATITTVHEEIRLWVEERGGWPARIRLADSELESSEIRVDFPRFSGDESLERVPWSVWFDAFERRKLAFLCQAETEDGQLSLFNELVSRESVERALARIRRRDVPARESRPG